jgi:hypothetical protein
MSEPIVKLDDWAQELAERIVGDIPHSIYVRWAEDVPDRVAARLRTEFDVGTSDGNRSAFVDEIVRSLPGYLPALGAARMRAKLAGALMTAGALGRHTRQLGTASLKPVQG